MSQNASSSRKDPQNHASRQAAGRYLDLARRGEVSDFERLHFLETREDDEAGRAPAGPVAPRSWVIVIDLCRGSDEDADEEEERPPGQQNTSERHTPAMEPPRFANVASKHQVSTKGQAAEEHAAFRGAVREVRQARPSEALLREPAVPPVVIGGRRTPEQLAGLYVSPAMSAHQATSTQPPMRVSDD